MATTSYQYSISATANSLVALSKLQQEIQGSAIVVAIDHLRFADSLIHCVFKDALSTTDQTLLASVIAAHDGVPPPAENATVSLDAPYVGGRPSFQPNIFEEGVNLAWCGSGDDIASGKRWGGASMMVSYGVAEGGQKVANWQFKERLWLAGGHVCWVDAKGGDTLQFELRAPATVGTSNPGAGAFDKVALGGGANIYVPNGTTTGGWDIDLAETLNANVAFTKAVPVTAPAGDGYFDYDSATDTLTVNATATGGYNLFDFEVTMSRYVADLTIAGTMDFDFNPQNIKPNLLLPHWTHRLTVDHANDGKEMCVIPTLLVARLSTQPE